MSEQEGPVTITGQGRDLAAGQAANGPLRAELRETDFTLTVGGAPMVAGYRDLTSVAVQQGQVLLVLADGAARVIVEGLGDRLGLLVSALRDRRARQLLADRLIELAAGESLPLVEYRAGAEHGVAQLAYHAWGAALLPLEERRDWHLLRRARIERVEADRSSGNLQVDYSTGPVGGQAGSFELGGLGAATEQHRVRMAGLREAALADAARTVARLLPDAPFAARRTASQLLVDGRPVDRVALGEAWPLVEQAVLSEPTFATAYGELLARGGGPAWLALAPVKPGTDEHRAWFFVGLPGNLVAMEIVSAGAHATYLFSVVPRAGFRGESAAELAEPATDVVTEVSEALIDMRFLREPIYLPADRLADPRHLRSRLAVAALPSLQAARARFVGRLIHRDEEAWSRSLDAAIAWHAAARDDSQRWLGGAADYEIEEAEETDLSAQQPIEEGT
jgi:hypothetical protein